MVLAHASPHALRLIAPTGSMIVAVAFDQVERKAVESPGTALNLLYGVTHVQPPGANVVIDVAPAADDRQTEERGTGFEAATVPTLARNVYRIGRGTVLEGKVQGGLSPPRLGYA